MRLNHLNLTVTDVPATVRFLETYFGLRNLRDNSENRNFAVLMDDGGLVLTLMRAGWPPYGNRSEREGVQVKYPGNFHIGFAQESEERVNEIYRRLKDDGFDVAPPQR